MNIANAIKQEAVRLGFNACGIAKAEPLTVDADRLQHWLELNAHATLSYMEQHIDMRCDPRLLEPGTQSVIVTLINYKPSKSQPPHVPQLAKYAYGTDYHYVIREKLKQLLHFIQQHDTQATGRAFADSAPIMERAWAVKAGLGFIGKNGMLIAPGIGSYTFIGTLLVSTPLPTDQPIDKSCGSCQACLEACPTKALRQGHWMQTQQCLSYQTIEKRGDLEPHMAQLAGNRLFGCDTCIDVCPWNKKATSTQEPLFEPTGELLSCNWNQLTRSEFKTLFQHSAVQRAGYRKIINRINQINNQINTLNTE